MAEAPKFVPKGALSPEVTGMQTAQKARLLMPGLVFSESREVTLPAGRTVDQMAATVDPEVYGIQTFKRVEGTVNVAGKSVDVKSAVFDLSGITYVGGRVMGIDEVKRTVPDNKVLVSNMGNNGFNWLLEQIRDKSFL